MKKETFEKAVCLQATIDELEEQLVILGKAKDHANATHRYSECAHLQVFIPAKGYIPVKFEMYNDMWEFLDGMYCVCEMALERRQKQFAELQDAQIITEKAQ